MPYMSYHTQSQHPEMTSDGQAEHAHDAVHGLVLPSHCAAPYGDTIQHKQMSFTRLFHFSSTDIEKLQVILL